jgi:hypothetical protein
MRSVTDDHRPQIILTDPTLSGTLTQLHSHTTRVGMLGQRLLARQGASIAATASSSSRRASVLSSTLRRGLVASAVASRDTMGAASLPRRFSLAVAPAAAGTHFGSRYVHHWIDSRRWRLLNRIDLIMIQPLSTFTLHQQPPAPPRPEHRRPFHCLCVPNAVGRAARVPGRDAAAAGHRHPLGLHGQGGLSPRAHLQRLGAFVLLCWGGLA